MRRHDNGPPPQNGLRGSGPSGSRARLPVPSCNHIIPKMADRSKPIRESAREGAYVAGWENKSGKFNRVFDDEGKKVGRAPSNSQLERAQRVIIRNGDDFYTVGALTKHYDIDEAIDEILDYYKEQES